MKSSLDRSYFDWPNADGISPRDIVLMHRNERTRKRLYMIINSENSMSNSKIHDASKEYKQSMSKFI